MPDFKFSLISDMHVDHPQPKTPYDALEQFVVVAGDTANGLLGTKFLKKLKNKGFDLFAVDGNHEHYANLAQGRSQQGTEQQFLDLIGQRDCVQEIQPGLTIVGLNGWYTCSDEAGWRNYMNDSLYSQLNAAQVNELAQLHADAIAGALATRSGKFIVVTHTAPCKDTLDPKYSGHYSNEWYWNPHMLAVLREFSDRILVWCHGHTHASNDKIVDGVRVVCNPRGYPGENPSWKPKTVEVTW